MSDKQKVRIMGVCFLMLGIILYLIGEVIFALVMVFGAVAMFFIADKATRLKGDNNFMEDDFRYGR